MPKSNPDWLTPGLHSVYLHLLFRHGALPQHASIRLSQSPRILTFLEVHNLLEPLRHALDIHFAITFGKAIAPTAHGLMGQAAIAAHNIKTVLKVLCQYTPVRNDLVDIKLINSGEHSTLSFQAKYPLGNLEPFIVTATVVTLMNLLEQLLPPEDMAQIDASVDESLAQKNILREALNIGAYGTNTEKTMAFTFPHDLLLKNNILADSLQFSLATRGCEDELLALRGTFAAQVKRLLNSHYSSGWLTVPELAREMNMSARTLIRRLTAEGCRYSDILAEARCELACWYLKDTDLPIAEIAEKLGYDDNSNFSRTFRHWKQLTPSDYRRLQRQPLTM